MRASAVVECAQPARLARAMGRHFGHKVPVETSERSTVVRLAAGAFELVVAERALIVHATADRPDDLARVEEVAANHLVRFARPERIEVAYQPETEGEGLQMTERKGVSGGHA